MRIIKNRKFIFHFIGWLIPFIFLFLPLVQAQNNSEEVLDVFRYVKEGKSLLSNPQFFVIDDFNTGKFKMRQGATWRIREPIVGALELSLEKEDSRNRERGYSMKARFNLEADEKVLAETFLGKADVSQAQHFAFKAKVQMEKGSSFTGRIRVELKDWRDRKVIRDVTAYFPFDEGGWKEIILPMTFFKELDLDQLARLSFTIISKEKPLRGNFWIDEIAFFGFNHVSFESQLDNLVGFPRITFDEKRRERLQKETDDQRLLKAIAFDTWKFFVNSEEKNTHMVTDHIRLGSFPLIADYTSVTNVAMDLMGTISAMDFEFISRDEAVLRVGGILNSLDKMPKFKNFFYNFYDTKKLSIGRPYISSVDSGWLAIALVVSRQAFKKEFENEINKILDGFDFNEFLDPENNQLVVGLDVPIRNFGQYHYGMLVTEARATSLYAIGKGDINQDHWWFLYRTLPEAWKWQSQTPKGKFIVHEGVEFFQGYYEKNGKKFVPSWGGSLFEALMPTLVLKERELAPKGLGLNNQRMVELHRDLAYAKKYPIWGMSPCAISSGRKWAYREYGAPELGAKGYPDLSVITPHVSFLALDVLPAEAIKNIRRILENYQSYGEYGFYDSINLKNKQVNPQYLALDQGMILIALSNYLNKGSIQNRFHADPIGKKIESLLTQETFFQ